MHICQMIVILTGVHSQGWTWGGGPSCNHLGCDVCVCVCAHAPVHSHWISLVSGLCCVTYFLFSCIAGCLVWSEDWDLVLRSTEHP
jgi:hypothetical protein